MKYLLLALALLLCATAQTLPTLPPVNTLTAAGVTCTFSVADAQMSVATECLGTDGSILTRSVHIPNTKGSLLGTGSILCLYWQDATSAVRLQCSTDDDTNAPKLALDGKLAPVAKKRNWWLFWK